MTREEGKVVHNRDKGLANQGKSLACAGQGQPMADALVSEMQAIVRRAAEPWRPGDSVKAGIARASRRLDIGFRRARTFWYGNPCAVLALEADRLREADLRLLADERHRLASKIEMIRARINARAGVDETETDSMEAPVRADDRAGAALDGGPAHGACGGRGAPRVALAPGAAAPMTDVPNASRSRGDIDR